MFVTGRALSGYLAQNKPVFFKEILPSLSHELGRHAVIQQEYCRSELNDGTVIESEGEEVRAWIVWVGQNLSARMVFVLAQCTETICHYTSESKTGTPCIVMCTCLNYWCPLTASFL